MVEIKLSTHRSRFDEFSAFEAELAAYNISVRLVDLQPGAPFIRILVETNSDEQTNLVQELASLCFSDAHKV